jgi:hypothetical protein
MLDLSSRLGLTPSVKRALDEACKIDVRVDTLWCHGGNQLVLNFLHGRRHWTTGGPSGESSDNLSDQKSL